MGLYMCEAVRGVARGRLAACVTRELCTNVKKTPVKKDLSKPMATAYNPGEVEQGWYCWWEDHGFFRRSDAQEKFVMAFPPPNVTGSLHLGHALTCSIQDAVARWQQMQGSHVVFIPGADHAGIATQVVVERHLWDTQGKTKHDIGRKKFVDEVWRWKEEKGTMIFDQLRRLGTSLDWDRAVFTMDEHMNQAVTEAFIRLYDAGLVYRKEALVNWCCSLQSAISDIEVDHLHLTGPTELTVPGYSEPVTFGKMYDFAYRLADSGVVKVTPGHSHEDCQVGERHNLPFHSILDGSGKITNVVPEFEGLARFEARGAVLRALSALGLYRGCRAHPMMVPRCSRTQDVIEPVLRPQWFVHCKELAQEASEAVQNGCLSLVPELHRKSWHSWLDNITDWCVSRQLWWGHRIPVYHVTAVDGREAWVAAGSEEDARRKAMEKEGMSLDSITSTQQEEDVLDTWFSSGLFPFAALGWPGQERGGTTSDLDRFYPTTLVETGHDILFFWVARMVMLGLNLTGRLPFETVLLHGLLCDAGGHKMSKSRGNVIDPLDVISGASLEVLCKRVEGSLNAEEVLNGIRRNFPAGIPECGADALRYTLCSTNFKNQLLNIDVTRMEQNKFFGNKIWQTVRFLLSALDKVADGGVPCDSPLQESHRRQQLGLMDRWIMSHLTALVTTADNSFKTYDLHVVTKAFSTFWHNQLCDVYLESIKTVLRDGTEAEKATALQTLWTCIDSGLRLVAPFMPYLAEELYQRLPRQQGRQESVMQCGYPLPKEFEGMRDTRVEEGVEALLEVASALRTLKTSYGIFHNRVNGTVVCSDRVLRNILTDNLQTLTTLGRMKEVKVQEGSAHHPSLHSACAVSTISSTTTVYLHLQGVVDPTVEVARLTKKLMKLEKDERKVVKMVTSPGYSERSPPHIQLAHHTKLHSIRTEIEKVRALIHSLEDL
ncbi:Valine--tRNA ligase [Portunus trituberculatus]|uniref:Valine--tRNA ligase n=1 Tax=Portunus trituberculatus TaxID=210409 RepID=A0A5B7EUD2_PORTR|nr:Valine--tRNA ligase [Portunus trituberculatus]